MSEELVSGAKELAEYTYGLGQKSKVLALQNIPLNNNESVLALVPNGVEIECMDDYMPTRPKRKAEALKMYEPASFVKYVNEHKSAHSRIFANIQTAPYTFKAVIDWHETGPEGKADWGRHTCSLELALSDSYKTWKKHDGEFFSQADFAEFLKDNRMDIVDPDNAEILQLVMGLEATSEAKYNSKLATNKGVTLAYTENVTTTANGQKVEVPEDITLKIPVFTGMDEFKITCDFKFRAASGSIVFAYRMIGIDKLIRDTVRAAAEKLEKETALAVFI